MLLGWSFRKRKVSCCQVVCSGCLFWVPVLVRIFVAGNKFVVGRQPANCVRYFTGSHWLQDIFTLFHLNRPFKFVSKTSIFFIPIIGWSMFLTGGDFSTSDYRNKPGLEIGQTLALRWPCSDEEPQ